MRAAAGVTAEMMPLHRPLCPDREPETRRSLKTQTFGVSQAFLTAAAKILTLH